MKLFFITLIACLVIPISVSAESLTREVACTYNDGFYKESLDFSSSTGKSINKVKSFIKINAKLHYFVSSYWMYLSDNDTNNVYLASYLVTYWCNNAVETFEKYKQLPIWRKWWWLQPYISERIWDSHFFLFSANYGSETYKEWILDLKKMKFYYFSQFPAISRNAKNYFRDIAFLRDFEYKNNALYVTMWDWWKFHINLKNKKFTAQ